MKGDSPNYLTRIVSGHSLTKAEHGDAIAIVCDCGKEFLGTKASQEAVEMLAAKHLFGKDNGGNN